MSHGRRNKMRTEAIELASYRKVADDNDEHSLDPVHAQDEYDGDAESPRFDGSRRISEASVNSFELYTPDEDRAVLRKLDRNLVFFMSFLYLLSFLDRSNIGNARIAGLMEDLQLTDPQFEWLLTAFYITYIGFEWMILLYHYLTPHVYISLCVLSWGLLASLQAVVTSFPVLLIIRALLGLGEAAFSPGVPFYFSFFFRREELAFRAGLQLSAAPLASSFAGSLAWLITRLGQNGPFAPWRLLFLIEGFPGIIAALIAWTYVPDSPETAAFLTPRERKVAQLRLRTERSQEAAHTSEEPTSKGPGGVQRRHINWREIGQTLADPKCYLTALMFLNCNIAFSSMPVFLPTVLRQMGHTALTAQGLSAPPYLVAFVALLVTAWLSDRWKARSSFVMFHAFLGCAGYSLIALGGKLGWSDTVRYICVYPAATGFFSAVTIIITWTLNNQRTNAAKGTGMTMLNLIGQCGPLIGTRLYPDSDGPFYVMGMSVCAGAMALVGILALILRIRLARENRNALGDMAMRAREHDGEDEAVEMLAEGETKVYKKKDELFLFII